MINYDSLFGAEVIVTETESRIIRTLRKFYLYLFNRYHANHSSYFERMEILDDLTLWLFQDKVARTRYENFVFEKRNELVLAYDEILIKYKFGGE